LHRYYYGNHSYNRLLPIGGNRRLLFTLNCSLIWDCNIISGGLLSYWTTFLFRSNTDNLLKILLYKCCKTSSLDKILTNSSSLSYCLNSSKEQLLKFLRTLILRFSSLTIFRKNYYKEADFYIIFEFTEDRCLFLFFSDYNFWFIFNKADLSSSLEF
jgi:hypothetical protein